MIDTGGIIVYNNTKWNKKTNLFCQHPIVTN